ncbi:MAG: putative glutathione S-transferase-related transrane protein [Gammaproteobacteria bacterium]|nr:putative glutathione S-transferase-related transrane protein [Gammaproteobacteria bacterium]
MTSTIHAASPDEPTIVITRMFDAPRELIWKAITDPKQVALWFGGQGFTNPVCEMDVRPGGTWHHVMQAPNGPQFTIDSVFLEVVEPERLVWTSVPDPKRNPPPPAPVNTVTLEVHGAQTKWTLVARFSSIEERDRAAQMGFARMISEGAERVAELLKTR